MASVSKIKRNMKRSAFCQLLQTISPMNRITAKVDALGGAIVIGIIVSGVMLMRTLLSVQ